MSERDLLFAVLEMAVRDKAEHWFTDSRDEDQPFSFRWTAAHLGLDATRIAARLPQIAADLRAARKDPRKNRGRRPSD